MTTWLLSSSGRRGALVQILKSTPEGSRVAAVDASPLSAAGLLADSFATVPRVVAHDYVDSLLDFASRNHVERIVPTIDPELPILAAKRGTFRRHGIDVLISSPSVTNLSGDKWQFYKWLTSHGLPTPKTVEYHSVRELTLDGPVVAKPRDGSSSKGIQRAEQAHLLTDDELNPSYIIQEEASGIEVTVDFAVDDEGTFLGAVPRRRLEVRAGEVSKGVTLNIPEVEKLTKELASLLDGAYGILNVQMFYDPDTDHASIIELNARVGGGFPLSAAAGANFFESFQVGAPKPASYTWEPNLMMLRFDDAVFIKDRSFSF